MAMEMAMELGMGSHQAWMGAPWVFALCDQSRGQGVEVKRPKSVTKTNEKFETLALSVIMFAVTFL